MNNLRPKKLTPHCIVLDREAEEALQKIFEDVKKHNFRISFSMITRWALKKTYQSGKWRELYHIF